MTDAGGKAVHVERVIAKPRREYPFRGDRRDDYRELPVLEAENGG